MTNQELFDKYTVSAHVDWNSLCENEQLSEDFIREFADRVDWRWISECQTLTDEFREEFKDKF